MASDTFSFSTYTSQRVLLHSTPVPEHGFAHKGCCLECICCVEVFTLDAYHSLSKIRQKSPFRFPSALSKIARDNATTQM